MTSGNILSDTKPHYQVTIEKYSDYTAHDPYWINLSHAIEDKNVRQDISDALNDFFEKHGPDANEDYAGCCGPLMKLETCRSALEYAIKKCGKIVRGIDINDLIDGVGSVETDGRENDPVTGELLHACPVNEDSTIDEIDCLIEQDKLEKDDWVWLDFVLNSFCDHNSVINSKLRQLTRKHR